MQGRASNEDTPRNPEDDTRMSFGQHLEDLRGSLIRGLLGTVLATCICLYFGRDILSLILQPLVIVQHANGMQPNLQALSPTAGFVAYLKISLTSGVILSMPWLMWQMWNFVALGLYEHERRFVRWLIAPSTLLFILGVLFLYAVVLPLVLQFFITFNRAFGTPDLTPSVFQQLLLPGNPEKVAPEPASEPSPDAFIVPILKKDPAEPQPGQLWVNSETHRLTLKTADGLLSAPMEPGAVAPVMQSQFAIDYYISFVLMMALAFGIAFETPVVVFFLAWTGIVSTQTMKKGRRYVILVMFIAAAILTPPDVISQVLLAGPMYLLFEGGMLVAGVVERRSAAATE